MYQDKNNLTNLFSRIAPYYDFLNHFLSFNNDKSWRKKLVDMAQAKEGTQILDLCTGTADSAIEFVKRENDCQVFGVDFSHAMLRNAGEKIKELRLKDQIRLVEADVFALPFQAGHFDIVSISFGLRNLIDYQKGIIEMVKMLKNGGRVVIIEFSPPAGGVFGGVYNFYLRKILPLTARILGGSPEAYKYLSSSVTAFLYPEEILRRMRAAGLKNLYRKKMNLGIVNLYSGEK